MSIKYIVFDEEALGYMFPEQPTTVGPLAGRLFGTVLGAGAEPFSVVMDGSDKIRPATKADFEKFRVMLPPDFKG